MKKLFNRLSTSGKIDVDSLREDTYSDEEQLDTHIRKPESLPADSRDTSQDIKLKKSFSVGGGGSRDISRDYDFSSAKKKSSSGIKKDKESKDKEKLNESGDKSIRKSSSLRKSDKVKKEDSMKSPALKSIFVSSYEHQKDANTIGDDSDSEEEDSVPRSRGNSLHDDEFYTTTPIRVPSAPGRMASPVPFTPPHLMARATSPRASPITVQVSSSPQMAYSPPASPYAAASSPTARVPTLPRSVSSPNPRAGATSPHVVVADEFDARFNSMSPEVKTNDSYETSLGADFAREHSKSAVDLDVDEDVEMEDDEGELMNQKVKSGRFTFGSNKPKKLK